MAFKTTRTRFETEAEEQARLAEFPEGSLTHTLSTRPVSLTEDSLADLAIELPWHGDKHHQYQVIVEPIEFRGVRPDGYINQKSSLRKRNIGSWICLVVSSNHPSYPPANAGHRVTIRTDELVRGHQSNI
ncbi:hypothetical protein [Arthrobacter castelli]|uniref:hypothetical protein n=1 Tax=Arthrobacter castelli TaxID=271431 RepID=UPI000409366A|nr:hypothetical protein [Arthrobacter castelli]